jgi:hypothetical protein
MTSIKNSTDAARYVTHLNAVRPIDPAQIPTTPAETASQAVGRARPSVNLFDQSNYQAKAPVTLPDGSVVALPSLSHEEAEQARGLFAQVSPEHHEALNAASTELGRALMASGAEAAGTRGNTLNSYSKLATSSGAAGVTASQATPDVAGATGRAQSAYTAAMGKAYGSSAGGTNYDSTVQAVAYMGVLGLQNELGTYAQGMLATQTTQNTLRADQAELQTAVGAWPADGSTQNFSWHEYDKDGNLVAKSGDLTLPEAKAALSNVQSGLSALTDQNQLDAIQLQNMTQNYQNGINTISNLMKAAYDTTKNTIGNIHY